jgi:hypothetical protein
LIAFLRSQRRISCSNFLEKSLQLKFKSSDRCPRAGVLYFCPGGSFPRWKKQKRIFLLLISFPVFGLLLERKLVARRPLALKRRVHNERCQKYQQLMPQHGHESKACRLERGGFQSGVLTSIVAFIRSWTGVHSIASVYNTPREVRCTQWPPDIQTRRYQSSITKEFLAVLSRVYTFGDCATYLHKDQKVNQHKTS